MNKSKEVLYALIHDYVGDLELYESAFPLENHNKEDGNKLLSNMIETSYKLMRACDDLRKEIAKENAK